MLGTARRRIGFGVLTSLAIAGVVGVSSMSVSGVVPPTATDAYVAPYGTLTIEISDRAGKVIFNPVGVGLDNVEQAVKTVQPCNKIVFDRIAPGVAGNLIELVPIVRDVRGEPNTVQIPSDGIGVHDGSNCGTPAGLFGPSEKLEISIGSYFTSDVSAVSAGLVIGKSSDSDKDLIVQFGTEVQTRTVAVGGQSLVVKPLTGPGTFDTLTLSSTAIQKSRGLSVRSGTVLNLVVPSTAFEVAVNCGEQVTQTAGGIATSAVFFRGENAVKPGVVPPACADVGASVDIRTGTNAAVFWDNSRIGVDGSTQAVRGTITIEWAPVPVAAAAALNRQIDYDGDASGVGFLPTLWCESFTSTTALDGKVTLNGVLPDYPGVGSVLVDPDGPGAGTLPAELKAPWCLVSDNRVLQGGTITQTEVLFGSGDPLRK